MLQRANPVSPPSQASPLAYLVGCRRKCWACWATQTIYCNTFCYNNLEDSYEYYILSMFAKLALVVSLQKPKQRLNGSTVQHDQLLSTALHTGMKPHGLPATAHCCSLDIGCHWRLTKLLRVLTSGFSHIQLAKINKLAAMLGGVLHESVFFVGPALWTNMAYSETL